jgi:hypothetical protein
MNSEFSPTYDEIIFFTCLVCSKRPIPKSSTPASAGGLISPLLLPCLSRLGFVWL